MPRNNNSGFTYNPGFSPQDGPGSNQGGFNPGGAIGGFLGSLFGGPFAGAAGSVVGNFLGQHGVSGPGGGISGGGGGGSDGYYATAPNYSIRTRGPDGSPTNTRDVKAVLSHRGTWKPKSPKKRKKLGKVKDTSIQELRGRLRRANREIKKWNAGQKQYEKDVARNKRLNDINLNVNRYGAQTRPDYGSRKRRNDPYSQKNWDEISRLGNRRIREDARYNLRNAELRHNRAGRLTLQDNQKRQRKNKYDIKVAKAKIRRYSKKGDKKNVQRWSLHRATLQRQNSLLKRQAREAIGRHDKRFPGPGEWKPGDDAIRTGSSGNRSQRKNTRKVRQQKSKYQQQRTNNRSRQAQASKSRSRKQQQQRSRYQKKRTQSKYQNRRRKVNNRSKYSKPAKRSKYQSRSRVRNLRVNRRKTTTRTQRRQKQQRRQQSRYQQRRRQQARSRYQKANNRSRYSPSKQRRRSRVRNLRVNNRKATTRRAAWNRRR